MIESNTRVTLQAPSRAGEWSRLCCGANAGELFKCLPRPAMDEFLHLSSLQHCPPDSVLVTQEQVLSHCLLIVNGSVLVHTISETGKRLVIGLAGPGDMIGLAFMLNDLPSAIGATARYHCTIARIQRKDFQALLMKYPLLAKNVVTKLSQEYTAMCNRLRLFGMPSVTAKIAGLLLEWCSRGKRTQYGTKVHMPLTHEQLAECVGTTRETFTRTLARFRVLNLVDQEGCTLTVRNPQLLALYANGGL